MAGSLNRVTLIGRLGKDPESKTVRGGDGKLVNLRLATSESWKSKKTGEWEERTEWHTVVIWDERVVDRAEKLSKGDLVFVEGQMQTREWESDSGKRYVTEVVIRPFTGQLKTLEPSKGDRGERSEPRGDRSAGGGTRREEPSYDAMEDDIPF